MRESHTRLKSALLETANFEEHSVGSSIETGIIGQKASGVCVFRPSIQQALEDYRRKMAFGLRVIEGKETPFIHEIEAESFDTHNMSTTLRHGKQKSHQTASAQNLSQQTRSLDNALQRSLPYGGNLLQKPKNTLIDFSQYARVMKVPDSKNYISESRRP